jgi:hypothetical protein
VRSQRHERSGRPAHVRRVVASRRLSSTPPAGCDRWAGHERGVVTGGRAWRLGAGPPRASRPVRGRPGGGGEIALGVGSARSEATRSAISAPRAVRTPRSGPPNGRESSTRSPTGDGLCPVRGTRAVCHDRWRAGRLGAGSPRASRPVCGREIAVRVGCARVEATRSAISARGRSAGTGRADDEGPRRSAGALRTNRRGQAADLSAESESSATQRSSSARSVWYAA